MPKFAIPQHNVSWVRDLRRRLGWSLLEMACMTGVSSSMVIKWQRGGDIGTWHYHLLSTFEKALEKNPTIPGIAINLAKTVGWHFALMAILEEAYLEPGERRWSEAIQTNRLHAAPSPYRKKMRNIS